MKRPPSSVPRLHPSGAQVRTILVVDDNEELVSSLVTVLEEGLQGPVDVATAARGASALALGRTRGFDVAIVDVKLPDTSGIDLIAQLKEVSPYGEVVLLTGFASVDAAIGALKSGAFAFVLKSFRPEELVSTVEQALTKVWLKREREDLERRYRDLAEVTDVLVIGLDAHDHVALMNRRASSLAGTTPEAALGRQLLDAWIPEADRASMRAALDEVRRPGGNGACEVETGFVDLEGGVGKRVVRWHLSASPEGRGVVYGVGIDVTERRALERRAADAEALSAMGELAMNLAHEIRNPLNAAVLQLHLLRKKLERLEVGEDTQKELGARVDVVGEEVQRLNRLLTEFLELARPRGIAREPVHVGNLVREVLDLESETAKSHGVVVERDIASEGCVTLGDSAKLKQVVLNVVVNALEAMKTGGRLVARVASDAEHVVVRIEDTGSGIDAHLRETVFDPFFTTKEAGTGLGLSIVRKIVEQHGGRVTLESGEAAGGAGTRVTLAIPSRRVIAPPVG